MPLTAAQIRAYFQPIVDMRTGDVVAIEALARWQTDDGHPRARASSCRQSSAPGLNASLFHRMLDDGLSHLATFRNVVAEPAPGGQLRLRLDPRIRALQDRDRSRRQARHPVGADLARAERAAVVRSVTVDAHDELTEVAEAGVKLVLDDFGVGFPGFDGHAAGAAHQRRQDPPPVRLTGDERRTRAGGRQGHHRPRRRCRARDQGVRHRDQGAERASHRARRLAGPGLPLLLPQPPESLSALLSSSLSSWSARRRAARDAAR